MDTKASELVIQSEAVDFLNARLVAPYFNASTSSLGGSRFWARITVSLDARENWANKIFENSRYVHLSLTVENGKWVVDRFSGCHKSELSKPWRKTSVLTLEDVVAKVNAWVAFNLSNPIK